MRDLSNGRAIGWHPVNPWAAGRETNGAMGARRAVIRP
jgi:hypothetical protein